MKEEMLDVEEHRAVAAILGTAQQELSKLTQVSALCVCKYLMIRFTDEAMRREQAAEREAMETEGELIREGFDRDGKPSDV